MSDIKQILGYVFSGVGLVGLIAGVSAPIKDRIFGFLPEGVAGFLGASLLIISLIILGAGVFLLFIFGKSGGKVKQSQEEVPIYEGSGKKRKIVGYRKEED